MSPSATVAVSMIRCDGKPSWPTVANVPARTNVGVGESSQREQREGRCPVSWATDAISGVKAAACCQCQERPALHRTKTGGTRNVLRCPHGPVDVGGAVQCATNGWAVVLGLRLSACSRGLGRVQQQVSPARPSSPGPDYHACLPLCQPGTRCPSEPCARVSFNLRPRFVTAQMPASGLSWSFLPLHGFRVRSASSRDELHRN